MGHLEKSGGKKNESKPETFEEQQKREQRMMTRRGALTLGIGAVAALATGALVVGAMKDLKENTHEEEGVILGRRAWEESVPNIDPIDKFYKGPLAKANLYSLTIRVHERTVEYRSDKSDHDTYVEGEHVRVRYYMVPNDPNSLSIERVEKVESADKQQ